VTGGFDNFTPNPVTPFSRHDFVLCGLVADVRSNPMIRNVGVASNHADDTSNAERLFEAFSRQLAVVQDCLDELDRALLQVDVALTLFAIARERAAVGE
jgi:hypothetical protein